MNRIESVAMFCKLVSQVGDGVYGSQLEHDCICSGKMADPRVHPEVMAFIVNAVQDKLGALRDLKFRHAEELRRLLPKP
jgi:hypothetical protein